MRIALAGDFDTYLIRGLERPRNLLPYRLPPGLNLLRGFRELGIRDIHILVSTSEVRNPTIEDGPFGAVYRIPRPRGSGSATFFLWRRKLLLEQLRKISPDILHGQGTEREYAFTAVTSPYPNVITFHGIMARVQSITPPRLFSFGHVSRWAERIVTRKASNAICISCEVENFLRERRSSAHRYRIPNAVAPCYFQVRPVSRETGRLTLLFVGTIYPLKGVLQLIEAFAMLECNIRLRLIGPIAEDAVEYAARVRKRAAELCVSERVDWVGVLGERDIAREMALADALVLPSFNESFGMCIAEAMAAGLPVVATRAGGPFDLVEHERTGLLVTPGSVEELAGALRRLLNDSNLRTSLGAAARAKAQAQYTPRVVAQETFNVYEAICQHST